MAVFLEFLKCILCCEDEYIDRGRKQASIINLPEELIVEIMLRLPAKTLLRFRCINKSRRSLIANPDFIREHLSRSRSDASHYFVLKLFNKVRFGLTSADNKSLFFDSPPQLDLPPRRASIFHVVGPENGLVCLHQNIHGIHLWNPCLRQFRTLPFLKSSYDVKEYCVVVKFGFHQVSVGVDDCKVIKMAYLRDPSKRNYFAHYDVYSLNRNSWKSIVGHCLPFDFCRWPWLDHGGQVVVNGRIHWIGYSETPKDDDVLGYFDMNEEEFGVIPLPDSQVPVKCCRWYPVSLLKGCLCVILEEDSLPHVWVMKEYGVLQSWTKLYAIQQSILEIMEQPIGFTISGEILTIVRKRGHEPRKLISYDPQRSDKVKTILADFHGRPFVYTESLISVFSTAG